MTTLLRALHGASLVAAALLPSLVAADDLEPCAAYHVAGVRLGMASDDVRVRLGSLGTPAAAVAGDAAVPAALVFEIDGALVEVELDRRPRRRRPARVTAVRSARDEAADPQAVLEEFERRLGPADEAAPDDAGGPANLTRRWSSERCGVRLELAIDEQIEWWQPRARSIVVRLGPFVASGGASR